MTLLRIAGYTNILIAAAHLACPCLPLDLSSVIWAFSKISEFATVHSSLSHLLTLIAATLFLAFGLYGLSAADSFPKLPFEKIAIFFIATLFLFRGIALLAINIGNRTNSAIDDCVAILSMIIGATFFFGGLQKWAAKQDQGNVH